MILLQSLARWWGTQGYYNLFRGHHHRSTDPDVSATRGRLLVNVNEGEILTVLGILFASKISTESQKSDIFQICYQHDNLLQRRKVLTENFIINLVAKHISFRFICRWETPWEIKYCIVNCMNASYGWWFCWHWKVKQNIFHSEFIPHKLFYTREAIMHISPPYYELHWVEFYCYFCCCLNTTHILTWVLLVCHLT